MNSPTNELSNRKVFIGNLSYETRDETLRESLEEFGVVLNVNILRRRDGRSKGCGTAEFESAEGAQSAITNGQEMKIDERPVFIREDRDANVERTDHRLFVGNLPWSIGADELKAEFMSYGNLLDCRIPTRNFDGRSKGFALLKFETREEAKAAIAGMNETDVQGRMITVRWDKHR